MPFLSTLKSLPSFGQIEPEWFTIVPSWPCPFPKSKPIWTRIDSKFIPPCYPFSHVADNCLFVMITELSLLPQFTIYTYLCILIHNATLWNTKYIPQSTEPVSKSEIYSIVHKFISDISAHKSLIFFCNTTHNKLTCL